MQPANENDRQKQPHDLAKLTDCLKALTGQTPFPWQQELLRRFANGMIERSLDIPTGLGKTAAMAIWLVARAHGGALPRRLVYVVDRRAVVDQATDVAKRLRHSVDLDPGLKKALGLGTRSLPISTLRGQHVDNKEWLEDPSVPAIIVGTVDMIGSRLLFEGYGTTRKMRPYHAGLLGADTLVMLDEAHLVPPFEKLLEASPMHRGVRSA
jgi:CRISPR-associated endonuclease/helicase Cas3